MQARARSAVVLAIGLCGCGNTALLGTRWQTTTVGAAASADGVSVMTYSIAFNTDMSFSASLSRTFGAGGRTPGCVATTTISDGEWAEDTSNAAMPDWEVLHVMAMTTRTGCANAADDGPATPDDDVVLAIDQGAETFTISGSTMTTNGNGGVPYDWDTYTFVRM